MKRLLNLWRVLRYIFTLTCRFSIDALSDHHCCMMELLWPVCLDHLFCVLQDFYQFSVTSCMRSATVTESLCYWCLFVFSLAFSMAFQYMLTLALVDFLFLSCARLGTHLHHLTSLLVVSQAYRLIRTRLVLLNFIELFFPSWNALCCLHLKAYE
jgi:hypothetical protein